MYSNASPDQVVTCPVCGEILDTADDGRLYCSNDDCGRE